MMKPVLRVAIALIVVTAALAAVGQKAGASPKVGPSQYFTGVINGEDGNTAIPIVIQMACHGPLAPGETGHPVEGQTLAVHQLFPPSATATVGRTGSDSTVDVFFGAAPPAALDGVGVRGVAKTVSFVRYDKTKRLPTALILPCSGTGTVWFVPIPVVPPSGAAGVPVQFESQP